MMTYRDECDSATGRMIPWAWTVGPKALDTDVVRDADPEDVKPSRTRYVVPLIRQAIVDVLAASPEPLTTREITSQVCATIGVTSRTVTKALSMMIETDTVGVRGRLNSRYPPPTYYLRGQAQ